MIITKTLEIEVEDQEVRTLARQMDCPFHQVGILIDQLNKLTPEKIQEMRDLMEDSEELPVIAEIIALWKSKNVSKPIFSPKEKGLEEFLFIKN
jgi:hypothetical protein